MENVLQQNKQIPNIFRTQKKGKRKYMCDYQKYMDAGRKVIGPNNMIYYGSQSFQARLSHIYCKPSFTWKKKKKGNQNVDNN